MFEIIKRTSVFLLLLLVVGAFGCDKTGAVQPTDKSNGNSKVKKVGDYPPAPRGIALASLKALDDEDFSINDYKGKVVLVNLWATWCGPCIEEMPHFVEMQKKYGDDGFQVIGLNTDEESEEMVKLFVEKQKLNYKIGWATQEVADEFMKISKLPGIPQSLLLNRDGEMTGMFRGGGANVIEQMVESVDKLMAEKKK